MIEIIQEEKELPKNIKQIGSPDIGDRIYIEKKAYEAVYAGNREKAVYVLLGKFEDYSEKPCVFIEAAICIEEIQFEGDVPVWNDETWAYLYKKLRHVYDDMVVVGWAVDIRGNVPHLTVALEKLHRTYFGGVHQVLYLLDSLEQEDRFFSMKNGCLRKREGYYIYQEKTGQEHINVTIETAQGEDDHAKSQEKEKMPFYRSYLRQKAQNRQKERSYGFTVIAFLVICGLGYAAFQNHEKMNQMEAVIMQMNQKETEATEETNTVKVESVAGIPEQTGNQQADNVEQEPENNEIPPVAEGADAEEIPQEQAAQQETPTEQASVQQDATQGEEVMQQAAQETMTEPQQYLSQGYYIVQKGDSLVGICKKIYQTTAMMEKICEKNGISHPDEIYEGQYITLPK